MLSKALLILLCINLVGRFVVVSGSFFQDSSFQKINIYRLNCQLVMMINGIGRDHSYHFIALQQLSVSVNI